MFYYNARRTLELKIEEAIRHVEGKCEEHGKSMKLCPPCLTAIIMQYVDID